MLVALKDPYFMTVKGVFINFGFSNSDFPALFGVSGAKILHYAEVSLTQLHRWR